ncbi:MAG TPA: AsmA family protein [Gammaproteobacteria bacterium]|nr:AsmA family protein [Gammaproteobacteria bacterium]
MGEMLGKIFKLIVLVIILGIIAVAGYILLVGANHFKPQITQALLTYTGLPFQINGPLKWTLRPKTVITLEDVVLAKAPDDKNPALQIKEVTMTVDILSVLQKKPDVDNLTLNNVIANWNAIKDMLKAPSGKAQPCTIDRFELKNGSIAIQNPGDKSNWLLQNASLKGDNIMLNSNQKFPPLTMSAELINLDKNSKYTIDTTVAFDTDKHMLALDPVNLTWNDTNIAGKTTIEQFDTDPIFSGDISVAPADVGGLLKKLDPYFANSVMQVAHSMQMQTSYSYTTKDQILDLKKFNLQIDKGTLHGDVKLSLVAPYHAEFSLTADNIDFAPLSMLGSAIFPSIHTMKTVPADIIKDLVVKGTFAGTQVTYANLLQIEQLQLQVNAQNGVMQFTPVIINAYGGTHDMALSIDVTQQQPTFKITEQADKIDLEPWLKLIHEKNMIHGTASVKASLQASGSDLSMLKQTVTGTMQIFANNGTFDGVDATGLMKFTTQTVTDIFNELSTSAAANMSVLAVKRSSNWISTQSEQPSTKFDHLELVADFNQGVSSKSSLTFSNNAIELKGSGSFTLTDQVVNFNTTIINRKDIESDVKVLANYMRQTPLAMTITGTLDKPVFGPDVQGYVTTVLKTAQTDLQAKAVAKMVSVTPPNTKTDKTATDLFLASLQSLSK